MKRSIQPQDKLRVASINLSNNTSFYHDRVRAIIKEAELKNVDVLLLQEIVPQERDYICQIANEAGLVEHFISPSVIIRQQKDVASSTAIFSRLPLTGMNEMSLTALSGATKGAYGLVEFNGHNIFVMSVHLIRGAQNGYIRLKQSLLIEEAAARLAVDHGYSIVGGTFNDIPDGDSVRYLKGLKTSQDVKSTFWVDVTEGTPLADTPTTRYHSMLGTEAATRNNIPFPEMLPERKVDYLFTRGWVYGNVGMPMGVELFGVSQSKEGLTVSDHYGVLSDFWYPESSTIQ